MIGAKRKWRIGVTLAHMGGGQNYVPSLDPYNNAAPNI